MTDKCVISEAILKIEPICPYFLRSITIGEHIEKTDKKPTA